MSEKIRKTFIFIGSLPQRAVILLIQVYQATLSPDHGWLKARYPHGYCRFYPSCSEYSKLSFIQFGFLKGLILTITRLVRCHPWADPKVDPVPKHF